MGKTVEFYWEVGSTNSYFALHLLRPIAERHGAAIELHPDQSRPRLPASQLRPDGGAGSEDRQPDPRSRTLGRALSAAVPLPDRRFRSRPAGPCAAPSPCGNWDREVEYIDAIFAAYWERDDASIQDYSGLRPIAASLGADPDDFEAAAESDETRAALIAATDGALARGVFGAPTMIVGSEIFWGKDRMDFVERELAKD